MRILYFYDFYVTLRSFEREFTITRNEKKSTLSFCISLVFS